MNPDVLIVVDNSNRELVGTLLLQHYLNELGLSSQLCSRLVMVESFNRFHPKAMILPHALSDACPELAKRTFLFVLPSESGNMQRELVRRTMQGTASMWCQCNSIDLFFSWGEQMTDWLIEDKIYPEERICTTGSPSTDHWLLPSNRKINHKIGLTTTFRALSNNLGYMANAVDWIYRTEKNGGNGNYYESPEHVEVWIYWEAAFIRLICNMVEQVIIPEKLNLEIRPHPGENKRPYQWLTKVSSGLVKPVKEGVISEWLERIDLLLTYMSATGIDGYVKRLPIISLKNVLNQDALSRIPKWFNYDYYNFFWQLDHIDQIKEYADAAERGELPLAEDEHSLNEFIRLHFQYPRTKPSALFVAESIKTFIENNKQRPFKPLISGGDNSLIIKGLKKIVKYNPEAYLLLQYLRGYYPPPSYTYLSFKWKEFARAKATVRKIINSYKESSRKNDQKNTVVPA